MVTFKLFKLFWGEEGEFHKASVQGLLWWEMLEGKFEFIMSLKRTKPKMEEQRQEAQGKKSSAASAAKAQGTGIALPLVHSFDSDFVNCDTYSQEFYCKWLL